MKNAKLLNVVILILTLIINIYCVIMSIALAVNGLNFKFDIENEYILLSLLMIVINFLLFRNLLKILKR